MHSGGAAGINTVTTPHQETHRRRLHMFSKIQGMFQLKRSSSKRGLKGGGSSSSSSTYGGPTVSQPKALVVDDNPVNRKVLGKSLENLGVETREAKNGLEAIDLVFSAPNFDIIFMDRDMPMMDGLEATRVLRSRGVRTKIVGVSSRSTAKNVQEFMGAGLDEFYEKPINRENLTSVIQDLNYRHRNA